MDTFSQAKNIIGGAQNILLLPSSNSAGDSLPASLALFFTLKKLGKNVNIAFEEIPEKFRFLLEQNHISDKDFVISIDTSEKDIAEMRYEKNEKDLKIYLTLNRGDLKKDDISFPRLEENVEIKKDNLYDKNPDLLISIGARSLEDLG